MNVADLLSAPAGAFVTQAVLHALVAFAIVERAVRSWKIRSPVVEQRFRLIVVLFPVVSYPLYQLIDPDRGSIVFRLQTLFDSGRWLALELWGRVPLGWLFVAALLVTSLLFLIQELMPVARHALSPARPGVRKLAGRLYPRIAAALAALPGKKPEVFVIEDLRPMIYSTSGRNTEIILSSALQEALTGEQMKAALAHEIAHTARSRRPLLIAAFLVRVLLFFNPVVLLEFRRIVQIEEKICDDIAAGLSQAPLALAETLRTFYLRGEQAPPAGGGKPAGAAASLEEYSHRLNLQSRVRRLERGGETAGAEAWVVKFLVTAGAVGVINYFVV